MHHARSQTPPRLTEVRLYGHLRARFGKTHRYAVRSAAEAVRALGATLPGFRQYMTEHSAPGYRVWLGDAPVRGMGELQHPAGSMVRIVPVTAGAKSGGLGSIVLGAALIAASFYLPTTPLITGLSGSFSSIAFSMGFGLVLGGVSQLIAGSPKSQNAAANERPNNQPSYAFNGAVNTTGQGNAVPILIGRLRVGSQVVSTGLSTAQLA